MSRVVEMVLHFVCKYKVNFPLNLATSALTLRLVVVLVLGRTLKKESSRPCVVPVLALANFFAPFLTLSSLKALSPHRYLIRPSSSGSDHFN